MPTAALALAIACGAVTGTSVARPVPTGLPVTVDGASAGRSGIDRGPAQPLVALEPLATAAGWHLVRLSSGARVQGDDRSVRIVIGSRAVYEDSSLSLFFTEPPVERSGRLYLAAGDAARLFGLTLVRAGGVVAFRHPAELQGTSQIVELPAPPAPRPRPTPRGARQTAMSGSAVNASAGRVLFSMDRSGASSVFRVSAETHGAYVQSYVDSTGFNQLGPPTGTVTVGTKDRNVQFGGIVDPLNGLILRSGAGDGIDYYRADLRRDVFAAKRLGDGRSMVGLVSGAPGSSGSDVIAMLFRDGAYEQTIARRLRIVRRPWGDFSRELLVGTRGLGAAVRARTRGRTFLESTVSFATPGLPLGPNDAPISLDAGRALSPQTTVVGGFSTGPHQPLGPFMAISTRSGAVLAALTATNRTITGTLAYQMPDVSLQMYSVPGSQHASGAQARIGLRGATVDATLTSSLGSREASVEVRTAHPGLNLVAGAALPSGGRAGPIAGVSVPLGRALALEMTTRPVGSGKSALRLSLAVGIPARRPRQLPTLPAIVRVASTNPLPPLLLFVDGTPVLRFTTPAVRVNVTPGAHLFSAESLDGSVGALDVPLNVAAAGDTVELTLFPERAISGRVQLDRSASVAADFSLGGLVIIVQPGNITTETAADGSFVFAKQPFARASTIEVDAGALPRTLRAPSLVPLPDGDVVLTLRPGLPIERGSFH